jgi:DNA-binding transcriptional ArsR family regulator
MNLEEVVDIFRTDDDKAKLLAMQIANDRGREVLECVFEGRPKSASEIARMLDVPLPTVMFHIDRFVDIGIVKVVKTRMSKKLREIKYYGPAKRAILIIPHQKEETMSYIAQAVRSSVITPLSAALVLLVAAVTGIIVRHSVIAPEPMRMLAEDTQALEARKFVEPAAASFFSLQNPVLLVVLGCVLTLLVLLVYSYVKNKKKVL